MEHIFIVLITTGIKHNFNNFNNVHHPLPIQISKGKLLYLELVRTEENIQDIRGFENLKFEFVTIVTPKHVVLFHIENKLAR